MQAADRMVALTCMSTLFFAFCITILAADLTAQPAFSGQGDWAPDGQRIIYTSNESGTWQLYSADADGSDRQRLTTTQFNETFPSYAPDGKHLLFLSDRDGNREIYIKDLDGQVCRLTETSEDEFTPAWSPDGKRISFAFNEKDRRQSFLMDVTGENRQRFPAPEYDVIYPKVSLDGTEMLVTARKRGSAFNQIYVMNMDGSNPRNLSRRSQPNYNGDWSPGGSRIVFVSQSPGDKTTAALYTVHADGSGIRKITDTEAGCFQPRWSPDGKRIVFRLGWEKDHVGLFVMDSDGGHPVQITNRLK